MSRSCADALGEQARGFGNYFPGVHSLATVGNTARTVPFVLISVKETHS